jgi:hypothetical protein
MRWKQRPSLQIGNDQQWRSFARLGITREAKTMTDDYTTSPEEPSTASKIVDGIKVAGSTVGDAIETGLEPGMPLDIVVKAVREAPLAALGIAFMLGVVFARPSR